MGKGITKNILEEAFVQEVEVRHTSFGPALYIKIQTHDRQVMTWAEVWEVFSDRYPGRWAAQFFPPAAEMVDEVNIYHLFVLGFTPQGVSIRWR